ncbi:4Fe-4S dicluster domain-containing protein [Halobacteria archaeon AArc-m2/3/4]|uniref:4Fe-4S dicluster domain-containing protein n=1 Tax=Natronoglomus mannanivorans TaxID=2979990 RepID=A0ABT2QG86_9EURY|nr:4Fe-4S dicluster domain-containing protein [Halobacteria archaeon AArc-m2/3/4]
MTSEIEPSACSCDDGNCACGTGGCACGSGKCTETIGDSSDQGPEMPDLGQGWTTGDLDEEWEAHAEEKLETVDFDVELGVEMSRDAMRLARGELTEAEFHDKHHEAIKAEFGIDERPTKSTPLEATRGGDGNALPGVPAVEGSGLSSRRGLMKAIGGLAATGATASVAGCLDQDAGGSASATDGDGGDNEVQMGMVIDTDQCIACLKCSEACKEENNTDRGAQWMHVFRYEEDEYGETRAGQMPRPCQHCSEPSCTYVCPTQSRFKREEDGIVVTDYDRCIGCKYCEVACPYGVNFLGKNEPTEKSPGFFGSETDQNDRHVGGPPPAGVMGKCTFCVHRQDDSAQRGTTACEDDCPVDAIHFGDMNDSESDPREYLRENDEETRFKLLEQQGNEPNIVYLGNEPSNEAKPVDGPYTYEDVGLETLAEDGGDD